MDNPHMEKMLSVIREMQIQTTMTYHFTPTRMAIIENNKCWRGCGEMETLTRC